MWKNICRAAKILKASNIQSYKNYLRWVLGFRKLRSSKKVETIASCSILRVVSWKKNSWNKETAFFPLIFTMELSSAALSYVNEYLTLNFTGTFEYF